MTPNRPRLVRVALLGLASFLAACSQPPAPEPPPPPFKFESADAQPVAVRVTLDGTGVPFAVVTLADVAPAPDESPSSGEDGGPAVYLQGATDPDGWIRADVRIPNRISALDVIVDKPGLRGPWTDETLREVAGPFAPGARLTVLRGSVESLEIAMEAR